MKGSVKRAVIDTNVIISALLFEGKASKIVAFLEEGSLIICLSKAILDEYLKTLAYPKFRLSEEEIGFLLNNIILKSSTMIEPSSFKERFCRDESDDKFLACADAAKADLIISGDKDLLDLAEFGSIPILSLSEFLSL